MNTKRKNRKAVSMPMTVNAAVARAFERALVTKTHKLRRSLVLQRLMVCFVLSTPQERERAVAAGHYDSRFSKADRIEYYGWLNDSLDGGKDYRGLTKRRRTV
ncbi:MAG TPA: hypothetical protein VGN72_07875 [Tepidisphaeraceae bacterium]|jgi:hypothetical protein|nr:hypothetical protein [Tepidisphaeraceae bacterium]